jgi:hypothetical protein
MSDLLKGMSALDRLELADLMAAQSRTFKQRRPVSVLKLRPLGPSPMWSPGVHSGAMDDPLSDTSYMFFMPKSSAC